MLSPTSIPKPERLGLSFFGHLFLDQSNMVKLTRAEPPTDIAASSIITMWNAQGEAEDHFDANEKTLLYQFWISCKIFTNMTCQANTRYFLPFLTNITSCGLLIREVITQKMSQKHGQLKFIDLLIRSLLNRRVTLDKKTIFLPSLWLWNVYEIVLKSARFLFRSLDWIRIFTVWCLQKT